MLRGIHRATSTWIGRAITAVILGAIAFAFAIWGIGDIFRGFGRSTVAKIGRTEIGIEQFRQLYNDHLQQLSRQIGRPIPQDQARMLGLDRQLLGRLMAEAALDENARQMRLSLSDAEVSNRITTEPMFKGPNGAFDRARFEAVIRQMGYTEQRYVGEQRRQLLRRQIANSVTDGVAPSRATIDAQARYVTEQRKVDYVVLGAAQAGDIPAPTSEELTKYFEDRKTLFRAPEYRKITLLSVTPGEIAKWTEVSEADARKIYDQQRARYVTPEQREIHQIVFPNADEAQVAHDKIESGMPFEAVATDRGLSEKDTNLGMLTKSAVLDRAIADAAFASKEREVSAPIQGRFGTALVYVTKIEPEKVQPFEAVAADIKRELALSRSREAVSRLRDKIEDDRAGGATLAETAEKNKLAVITIEAIDRSGRAPDGKEVTGLPQGVDVLTAAFSANVGVESDPVAVPGGGFIWVDVVAVIPSRERKLEEVKDQVEKRWKDDQIAERLKTKATELTETLKTKPLAEVAAQNNLKVETAEGVIRNRASGALTVRATEQIFRTTKGGVGNIEAESPVERVIFVVTGITVPPLDPQSPEGKRVDEALRAAYTEDLLAQYITKLETDLGADINQSVLNQLYSGSTGDTTN
jgi:peptidyl-prolyl cis-trans isomerase D